MVDDFKRVLIVTDQDLAMLTVVDSVDEAVEALSAGAAKMDVNGWKG